MSDWRHRKPKDRKARYGYGYVGVWDDGTLGWNVAPYVYPKRRSDRVARSYPSKPPYNENTRGVPFYLCRITIKPVTDKRGRFIVRKVRPS